MLNPRFFMSILRKVLKKYQPKNKQELELLLVQEWNTIELSLLEKLVDSISSRLYECIKMKDYPTKY